MPVQHVDEIQRRDAATDDGDTRSLVDQAFARASGAPLIRGNHVRLLIDAAEHYPAWLEAIERAEQYVHFESYIIRDDISGRQFAEALCAKARTGVRVRVLYDWLGAVGKTPARYWASMRDAGVEVRSFNPFRLLSPLGWLRRDHRKCLITDARIAFITGLCIGDEWVGDAAAGIGPWRDTGIEIRGPAVAEVERAFSRTWALTGPPIPPGESDGAWHEEAGSVALRIVASEPSYGALLRVDGLVAAAARRTLWLTDAYFAGIPSYVQALRAAALDGVDVRLLVPGGTDIPLLQPLSRAGYRPLLEAGVRVFEWNGPMLHAKTAVADGTWARVGSTNLNVASWIGNYELDALVEDAGFAQLMEWQYETDLLNATELMLTRRPKLLTRRPRLPRAERPRTHRAGGSAGRATAGAVRLGNTVAAAVASRRVLAPAEARTIAALAAIIAAAALAVFRWPRLIAWPLAVILAWIAIVLVVRAFRLYMKRRRKG